MLLVMLGYLIPEVKNSSLAQAITFMPLTTIVEIYHSSKLDTTLTTEVALQHLRAETICFYIGLSGWILTVQVLLSADP